MNMVTFHLRFKTLAFVLYGIIAVWSGMALAETELSGPATLSNGGEYYRLTQDISTNGTAFTITGNDITLDLNGHTVTYNTGSSGSGVVVSGSNNVVKNGILIQGALRSGEASGVYLGGSNNKAFNLAVKTNGIITGEQYSSCARPMGTNSEVYNIYCESTGTTNQMAYSPRCIMGENRGQAGIKVHDNILVGCHVGVSFDFLGLNTDMPDKTLIYNNLMQHQRTPGTKAPFGVLLGKCRNVEIYGNTIISDNGRGIMIDGYGQGVPRGTNYVTVHNNRVDVNYQVPATGGQYVENNVMGLYDRYSSGDNTFKSNIVIVDNEITDSSAAVRIGSDAPDGLMNNIVVEDNTLIAYRDTVFRWAVVDEVFVTNNRYFTNGGVHAFNWDGNQYNINIGDEIIESGTTEIIPVSYTPEAPTGLRLTRFFNSYLLRWDDNLDKGESQTYEYVIYRDGEKLPISPRGGTFYVDVDVGWGIHTYSISALTLSGDESARSLEVSTINAKNGWWDEEGSPNLPNPPSGLKLKN